MLPLQARVDLGAMAMVLRITSNSPLYCLGSYTGHSVYFTAPADQENVYKSVYAYVYAYVPGHWPNE